VYSLIRVEREGLIEALKELSRIGYDGVEIVSDNSGGLSLDEFNALLNELNLKVIAIHGWGSDDEIKAQLYETRRWNKGLGQGIVDWKRLVKLAEAQGCDAYISEREYYHFDGSDGTAVSAAEFDYKFLRSL
jgi:sugar phosphate isomerase/epimerase